MRQILTILWDSYRLLTAKVMFWVVLAISAIVALIYASIGIDSEGFSVLFGLLYFKNEFANTSSGFGEMFYLVVFTNLIVTWWLAYIAIALGLISCSSIFPDFLSPGSVDVAVSKPIGRVQIFITKYLGSLIFVFLQVALFCLIVFLALGLRLDVWNWTIFWAVPILVFVFSLIYCVGVLVGVLTRSTMLSLLAMLLFWGACLLVQWGENMFYNMGYVGAETGAKVEVTTGEVVEADAEELEDLQNIHSTIKAVAWPLPKTREVTLMIKQKIKTGSKNESLAGMSLFAFSGEEYMEAQQEGIARRAANRHSTFYILGSSAIFELVVLSIACWRFSRKDY